MGCDVLPRGSELRADAHRRANGCFRAPMTTFAPRRWSLAGARPFTAQLHARRVAGARKREVGGARPTLMSRRRAKKKTREFSPARLHNTSTMRRKRFTRIQPHDAIE